MKKKKPRITKKAIWEFIISYKCYNDFFVRTYKKTFNGKLKKPTFGNLVKALIDRVWYGDCQCFFTENNKPIPREFRIEWNILLEDYDNELNGKNRV